MDQYPQQCNQVERQLLKQGRTLEQHCIMRDSGGFTKKTSPCIKDDLKKMMMYLYTTASTSMDYQDAGLLCLLWYLFGHASDLTFVRKQQLSISAGNVFFIRFIRVKTSEEQALPLFPDEDYATYPLLALGLALITQVASCANLLSHLPDEVKNVPLEISSSVPFLELLDDPQTPPTLSSAATSFSSKPRHALSVIGIHAQVNRVLDRVFHLAGVETSLTSHSFQRGGAQYVNGSSELSTQWIFDRGAWNLTTTNKAFAYVFNTPKKDHQLASVLSRMTPKQASLLPSLDLFDTTRREQIYEVIDKMFSSSCAISTQAFTVGTAVMNVLTAVIFYHYSSMAKANPTGHAVRLIEQCVMSSGSTLTALLLWSQHLSQLVGIFQAKQTNEDKSSQDKFALDHHRALIEKLLDTNRHLEPRLRSLEDTCNMTLRDTSQDQDDLHKRQAETTSKEAPPLENEASG